MQARYSASLLCADLGRLAEEIQALEAAKIDALHFDIMDGAFAPGFGLSGEFLQLARDISTLPRHVHLQVGEPERHVEALVAQGATAVIVHVEASTHIHRTLSQIREAGASPGIAILPATPLIRLEYLLPMVDRVLLLAAEPGAPQGGVQPATFERVRILRENIKYHEYRVRLEVEGGLDVENTARLQAFGADSFVLGREAPFHTPGVETGKAFAEFRAAVAVQRNLV